jgi:3-methyl-2-oxobutanoate hydroxymethyltransferase
MTTVQDLQRFKEEGHKFAVLTAYDYWSAKILDEAGIPVLLMGDSLGMVMLGYENTLRVSMEEMLMHARAVARGASSALLVGDMPFMSYQVSVEEAMRNAGRFLSEGGMGAVKMEGGGKAVVNITRRLVEAGIPVMGHLGLRPQSVHTMGGYKVQGKSEEGAKQILAEAVALEEAGAFAIVLEGIPGEVGEAVTKAVKIATIGIGAGVGTDGQVLVFHDVFGWTERVPKFVKRYTNIGEEVGRAAKTFMKEVEEGKFPGAEQTY